MCRAFVSIVIQKGLHKMVKGTVNCNIDLGMLSAPMRSKLISALDNEIAPVEYNEAGVLSSLYTAVCGGYNLPTRYYSKGGEGKIDLHSVTTMLYEHLRATMLVLTEAEKSHIYFLGESISAWRCAIPYDFVAQSLKTYAPLNRDDVAAAIKLVQEGGTITQEIEICPP